jgi:hypothetical protein
MIKLIQTCSVSPEQYDVMDGDKQIGYLRLRHGHFTASLYDPSGPLVYEANTIGDGMFDPSGRDLHLSNAVAAIIKEVGYEIEYPD